MPVLAFDYASQGVTPSINLDNSALLAETRVTRDWVFHGHVGTSSTQQNAPAAAEKKAARSAKGASAPEHESFWAKLKHLFGVGDSGDQDGGR
jgi:hypothetical protein